LLTGVFATKAVNSAGNNGLLYGNPGQLGVQLVAILAAIAISVVGTVVIMTLLKVTIGVKADVREQLSGLDISEHGEEAYFGDLGGTAAPGSALGEGVIVSAPAASGKKSAAMAS
jgi:Amt family ammonium transporter